MGGLFNKSGNVVSIFAITIGPYKIYDNAYIYGFSIAIFIVNY